MDLSQFFNSERLLPLALPVGIGLLVVIVTIFLRHFLYSFIHKVTSKTKTCFDDIMVRDTRIATLLWCFWLGIFVGWKIAETPADWVDTENKIVATLFAAIGIYSVIMIVMAIFKWYKVEVCPRTNSSLDDIIMSVLIFGTPIVGGGLGIILILNIWDKSSQRVNDFISEHGVSLAAMTVVTVFLLMMTVLAVPRVIDRVVRSAHAEQTEEEMQKRSNTLTSVIGTTIQVVIIFMFILMIASNMGMNITALLTGAGVVGIAIGFGAQSLVKDIISGLFVILENQYRKGDVVKIAGESGVVEEINLRRTILRDGDGGYHVVPNGEIRVATNYTKQMSRVNLNIGVSYDTDLDQALAIINRVGKEMAEDPRWADSIVSAPQALRIDNLGDSSVDIKIMGETKPSKQWDVTGELRLRLKKAFDKEGIEIPYPHTKVYFGNQPPVIWTPPAVTPEEKKETKKLNN